MGHLTDTERERIDQADWAKKLGVAPYVRVGRGWGLNKGADGACVFLDADNRCRIHAECGESAKPLACRIFPFSVRSTSRGWQASLRFDCPSVVASNGQPVEQHRAGLAQLVSSLDHGGADDSVNLQRGIRATPEELEIVTRRVARWMRNQEMSLFVRLVGLSRVAGLLGEARLVKVRGTRFAELLDLLFAAQSSESASSITGPTAKQRGMLRQLAFAHAEHVTIEEMRSGVTGRFAKRLRQLRSARAFLRGDGAVPPLHGFPSGVHFDALELVEGLDDASGAADDLLRRYFAARLGGGSVFGSGYYGWSVVNGLRALVLSVVAVGWLARYVACGAKRTALSFEDVAYALGVVDRAATRVPALGTMTERARVSYLFRDDGAAGLLEAYGICREARRG